MYASKLRHTVFVAFASVKWHHVHMHLLMYTKLCIHVHTQCNHSTLFLLSAFISSTLVSIAAVDESLSAVLSDSGPRVSHAHHHLYPVCIVLCVAQVHG